MYMLKNRVVRLIDEVRELLVVDTKPVEKIEIRKGQVAFPCDVRKIENGFSPFIYGDLWSEPTLDNYVLFRFSVTIPGEYDGKRVVLRAATNQGGGHNMIRPQMLLFVDGKATQGLDINHEHILLAEKAEAGRTYLIHIYAFSGMPVKSPYGAWVDVKAAEGVRFYADLEVRSDVLTDYYYNLRTPYAYLKHFTEDSYEYKKILHALNDSVTELDLRNPYSDAFYEGVEKANTRLLETLYNKEYSDNGEALLVGHTHIDLAWLWRYCHTRDKVARSFATAVKLLNEHEEHRFMSSQAQLYAFVKESFPELYEEIKRLAAEGKWEAEGAMWVEPDMNLCAGESIVRQILYGKAFFREEFGADCKTLWLPDVFGYSAALPQILKKAGVDYFMTAKIGTNEYNRFPYDTFLWRGIDGTEVLSHLITYLHSYAPEVENGAILPGWRDYMQKDINDEILIPFGFSDGGGGPTEEQIETIKRHKNGLPGVPRATFGTVGDFFRRLEKKVEKNRRLPVWSGEIYYEKHRGTYTSMARVKRQNRKCEFLYSNAEWLWALARVFGGKPFPKEAFDQGMRNMLLNQFHDVLPGSCIKEVYGDSDALYKEAFAIGEKICCEAVQTIAEKVNVTEPSLLVFNPYSEETDGYAELDGKLYFVKNVPAKGFGIYPAAAADPEYPVTVTGSVMENQYYRLTLSENGFIASLYDKKAGRECFIEGEEGNRLRIFEDKPGIEDGTREDNWNLDRYYTEREYEMPAPAEISVREAGGERGVVRVVRFYQSSVITQDIILYANSRRIDFATEIDWKEHSQVLRTEFPLDVNALRTTYEIQFGHLERSNTRNTSWEDAKYEVCAHKWADMADGGYGMALMNDCKYGYSAENSVLGMTLLRCGNSPNPDADKELHTFTYSILPHEGSIVQAEIVKEAYMLNNPLFAVGVTQGSGALPAAFSLFGCDGAVLETIKPAEDGNGLILRLYEPYNRSGKVTLRCGRPIVSAEICNLLEQPAEEEAAVEKTANMISLPIKPFEIITLRICFD